MRIQPLWTVWDPAAYVDAMSEERRVVHPSFFSLSFSSFSTLIVKCHLAPLFQCLVKWSVFFLCIILHT